MSLQRQLLWWLGIIAITVLVLLLLRSILLPFVAGMVLAYLLDPFADRLERRGLSRTLATSLIVGLVVLAFILVLVLLAPVVMRQLVALARKLPDLAYALERLLARYAPDLLGRIEQGNPGELQQSLGSLVGQGASWIGSAVDALWSGGQALVGTLSLLLITPVVAFYLLVDWDKMVSEVDRWLPRRHAVVIRELAREINLALAGFIRGQVLVCLLLGTFYAVGLTAIGLNFGLVIGMGAGLLSFIPYVGTIMGFLASTGVALFQFWPDWTWIVATVAIFVVGQVIEGNVLQPKLIGSYVGLHPVWLMFALLAFGSLFGFVGLLLAVPLAAAVGVLARFALRQYMASALYTGVPEVAEMGEELPASDRARAALPAAERARSGR